MSLLHFITLILLSGQVSGSSAQTVPDDRLFGWNKNQDNTLNYIVKLTPETANAIARGDTAAKVDVPDYVVQYMTSITIEVGDSPVERVPSEEQLKADLNKNKSSAGVSTLKNDLSNESKFANIDRKGPPTSRIQPVNQNGVGAFGIPSGGTSNPAISNAPPAYANPTTTNPALTGNTATSSPYSNPALPGRTSEPQYPINNLNNDRYQNSQSNIAFNDPPSVPTSGFNSLPSINNSQPLSSPFSAPSTYVPFNRGNDAFNGSGSSNFNRGGEPSSSNYGYGANNNQYPSNSGAVRPSTYPGSNTFPYQNGGTLVNTRNPQYQDEMRPDALISSNRDGIPNSSASSSDVATLALENSKLLNQINQLKNSRQNIYDETLTPQQIRDLESSAKLLLWFQLFSIVLFVACCFLGGSLFRLYNAYRNLRVSSRHAVNLGI